MRKIGWVAGLALLFGVFAGSVVKAEQRPIQYGSNGAPWESGPVAVRYGPTTAKELTELMDEKLPELMVKYQVPAFMFSYVSGDKILLNKGYGARVPGSTVVVDAEKNTLIVGSVAKLFVSTAIMQQVEQGRLKLDEDINTYLDFKIKNDFGKKITIKNVLQHTAGFEDTMNGQVVRERKDSYSLGDYVKNFVPKVVYEPGEVVSYSNYGYNLLARVVELTSGKEFSEYVNGNIFGPLEMKSSVFVKDDQIERVRNGFIPAFSYNAKAKTYKEQEYVGYWIAYPAGALVTNTHDLGNFMVMYLNSGRFKGRQILSGESVEMVRNEAFVPHPDLTGQALGFTVEKVNGHTALEKSGEALNSVGQVVLFPDYKQGFAYSYNHASSGFDYELRQMLANKFFPTIGEKRERFVMSMQDLKKFEGYYRYTRYNQSDFSKLMTVMSPRHNAWVRANGDGTISVGVMFLKDEIIYEPISKNSFQKVERSDILDGSGAKLDLGERIAFQTDERGRPSYMFIPFEKVSMERISLWQYGMVSMVALLFGAVMAVMLIVLWTVGRLIRLFRKQSIKVRIVKGQGLASGVGVGYAVGFIGFLLIMATKFNEELLYGVPGLVKLGMVVPLLSIPVLIVLVYFAIESWRKRYWNLSGRIFYSVYVLFVWAFAVIAWNYNLMSWMF